MINYMGSGIGTAYKDMQSISLAFGFLALLFLAAGAACFFLNKVYHSINISIYFMREGRRGKARPDRQGKGQDQRKKRSEWEKTRKTIYILGLMILAAAGWQERLVRGAQRLSCPVFASSISSKGEETGTGEPVQDEDFHKQLQEEKTMETGGAEEVTEKEAAEEERTEKWDAEEETVEGQSEKWDAEEETVEEGKSEKGDAEEETIEEGKSEKESTEEEPAKEETMERDIMEEDVRSTETPEEADGDPETEDIPLLYLQTEVEVNKGEREDSLILADRQGGIVRLILAEVNYLSDSMEENGDLYVNIEEGGRRSVLTYNWQDMVSVGQGLWAMDIPLKGEKNKELGYQIVFEYRDRKGQLLQAGDKQLEAFGRIEKGRFESCWFIVDGASPIMEEEISLAGNGQAEENKRDIMVVPDYVTGRTAIRDWDLDRSKIVVKAHPLDGVARKSAGASEQLLPDGNLDIPVFNLDRDGETTIIEARFQEEGKWQLYLSCADRSGNEGRTGRGKIWSISKEFIIDHTAPSLKISYSPDVLIRRNRVFPEDVDAEAGSQLARVNVKDCQLMFPGRQEIWLWICEDYFRGEDVKISLLKEIWDRQQGGGPDKNTGRQEGKWRQELVSKPEEYMVMTDWERVEEGTFLIRIGLKEEGNYRLLVSYEDLAGRGLGPDNSGTENCGLFMGEKGYQGPLITVDRSDPAILSVRCQSDQDPGNSGESEEGLYTARPVIILRISDENFCAGKLMIRDRVSYADGREEDGFETGSFSGKSRAIKWRRLQEEGYVYETSLPITKEGKHKLSFAYTDAAGHTSEKKELKLTYDCQGPVVEYAMVTNQQGKTVDIRQEEAEGLFLGQGIRIKIRVRDSVSGVEDIFYRYSGRFCDDQGKEYSGTSEFKKMTPESGQEGATADWTCWLEPETGNFIGRLELYTRDAAGNSSPLIKSREIAGETDWLHDSKSHIDWDLSGAAYVSEDDKIMYFRKSAKVKVRFRDDWSGIRAWTILVSDKDLSLKEILASCTDLGKKERDRSLEKEILVNGVKYRDSSADKPLTLYAAFIDYAGHYKLDIYDNYKLVMDQKKPSVRVEYDLQEDKTYGCYFNKSRTAKVTVSDPNFNPESVVWHIKGPEGGWKTGLWTQNGDLNTCMVTFSRDGGEYNLALEGCDYSGNNFSWDKDRSFVIDQTAPVITVKMQDQKEASHGKYYSTSKKLLVRIEDENLRDADLIIRNKEEDTGGTSGKSLFLRESLQKGNGYYYVWLTAGEDGSYVPEILCRDMAGNNATPVSMEEFVIDKTPPGLTFKGIREDQTFSGPVSCKISCQDQNLDLESIQIQVSSLSGKPVEEGRLASEMILSHKGEEVCGLEERLYDSQGMQLDDGIYRISVWGEDLAGNPIRGKTRLDFRVNRKGAVYFLDKDFKERLEAGYLRGTGQIRILEYSVNPTVTQVKLISENQNQQELSADDYYQKTELVAERGGHWSGWHKKTLCLSDRLFSKDGIYRILVKTKAMDGKGQESAVINQTDNEIRGQELSFKVDRTPPQVHLGGLDREIYEEREHSFCLTVMDNIAFDRLELSIEKGIFKKKKDLLLIRPGDLDDMNSILLTLKAYGGFQRIHYKAWDRAGNVIDSDSCGDSRNCLVAGISASPDKAAGLIPGPGSQLPQTGTGEAVSSEKTGDQRMLFFPVLFGGFLALLFITGAIKVIKDRKVMNGSGRDTEQDQSGKKGED